MAVAPEIQELLEAGVHFGHQSSRWNPKMRKYIFAARNGIHVIDLKKTHQLLQEAQSVLREIVTGGDRVLAWLKQNQALVTFDKFLKD